MQEVSIQTQPFKSFNPNPPPYLTDWAQVGQELLPRNARGLRGKDIEHMQLNIIGFT